ncbi:hypothetical protein BD410DRAFT_515012 [Rickenella mellea]|uniref:Uncharacterized protein n=1 Tax=Rickenella mellea TaxID=50990 RepID=A0A4Y7PSR7_9AGAM|nr:hypothetical protein BD410DRAFT_515012 [Rickenella mellea]
MYFLRSCPRLKNPEISLIETDFQCREQAVATQSIVFNISHTWHGSSRQLFGCIHDSIITTCGND